MGLLVLSVIRGRRKRFRRAIRSSSEELGSLENETMSLGTLAEPPEESAHGKPLDHEIEGRSLRAPKLGESGANGCGDVFHSIASM